MSMISTTCPACGVTAAVRVDRIVLALPLLALHAALEAPAALL